MPQPAVLTRALWVLFAINILNFYDRHILGALSEPIRREFGLSDSDLGWLGSGFIWLYALVGLPLGRLADSISRKKVLVWGVGIWSVLTACNGLAGSFAALMGARLGVAVGEAACAPTATSWIGDLFAPAQRSRALSTFMLGVPIGGALSYFLSGPMAEAFGWRAAMVVAAAPALVLIPILMTLPEPARGATESSHAVSSGSMWSVLRIPTLLWIIASGALLNFNMYAFGSFLPAFFSRVHGLTLAQSGIATGIVYAIGGAGGGLLAGRLGDAIIERRRNGRMLAGAVLALATAPLAWLGIQQQAGQFWIALPLFALAYAGCNTYYGFVYPSIQDIVAPAQRGTTMAVYFLAMYLLGASFGPLLTGKLSDRQARAAAVAAGSTVVTEQHRAIGLQQAMLIIPVLAMGLSFVLWAGSKTIEGDIRRRERAPAAAEVLT